MSDNYWNHDNLPKVGQIVLTSNGQEAEYRTIYEDQVCLHSETDGLIICTLSSIKKIPDPKKALRDNAIQEMDKVINNRNRRFSISENLYDAYFRKVKPLPTDWFKLCLNTDLAIDDYLIQNGHCIGGDE